jgi:peptidoglycan hydrolase CwlO-like protein
MAKKEKKPVQDIPEEENVITPDEFEQLEKKESKGRLRFLKAKPKPERPKEDLMERGRPKSDDDIVVAVEKIEAKLETMEDLRQTTEEKISRLSEEIGELRSSIMEKDKTFNQVESGFERVKEIFDEIQPKKIRAELDRKEDAIDKLGAKVEAFDTKISDVKRNVADVVSIMEKIKDIKNLVAVSETVGKKMAKIEDERKETAKIAAKVESMFSEITEKMSEFHNYRDKIEFSSESMHDIMKSIDMMEVRIENAVTKDDAKKTDDRFEQLEKDLTDKIQAVRDIVDDLATDLKKGGVKGLLEKQGKSRVDEINKKLSEIHDYDKGLKSLKDDVAKQKEEITRDMRALISEIDRLKAGGATKRDSKKEPKKGAVPAQTAAQIEEEADAYTASMEGQDIGQLMDECHGQIDRGNIEAAKKTYNDILAVYEQSKDMPGAEQLYGRIKRLYYRLQIY